MDTVSEINKVAARKRLSANAEKLREKIARENKNVLKLRVAQDTAYWDLKEQLLQVESNHEKLQANMVEVQMQHEAISGQYQDELRLRPDTLNKLSTNRQICTLLEDYDERLRGTMSRCRADQGALHEAYQKSGRVVRDLKTKLERALDTKQQLIQSLEEKVNLTMEHHSQLLQCFSAEKQRTNNELVDVKSKMEAMTVKKDELLSAGNELNRQLDRLRMELQMKDDTIKCLEGNINKLVYEVTAQRTEMKNAFLKQENELKEASATNKSLKQALTNQETFTKTVCDQNTQLQEQVATCQDELVTVGNVVKELKAQLEDATSTNDNLSKLVTVGAEKNEALEIEIADKNVLLEKAKAEIQNLKKELSALEVERQRVGNEVNKAKEKEVAALARVQQMDRDNQELIASVENINAALQECQTTADNKIKDLTATVASKDSELDTKALTIAQLMSEMKIGSDARAVLERDVQEMKKEMETTAKESDDRETALMMKIEQLEGSVKNKDNDLTNQMNIIRELRNDKERLNSRITSMQHKMDNIQKEISGATPAPASRARAPPELDDNAVMLSPAHVTPNKQTPMSAIYDKRPFAMPKPKPHQTLDLSFLSDSSMDGDNSLDPVEVNRRFEALSRGERLPPVPLSALKRRRSGHPAHQGGLRPKTTNDKFVPLAQLNDDNMQKDKQRVFFKTKRQDKSKKLKQ